MNAPGMGRRLACLPYEGLLLLAVLLIASFPAAGLIRPPLAGVPLLVFQGYLQCVVAAYFTWFWSRGGQTLAMKTWHIRVVDARGLPLTLARALLRAGIAALFFGPACAGLVLLFFPGHFSPQLSTGLFVPLIATLLWARFDDGRQSLHDRLAGTRLIDVR